MRSKCVLPQTFKTFMTIVTLNDFMYGTRDAKFLVSSTCFRLFQKQNCQNSTINISLHIHCNLFRTNKCNLRRNHNFVASRSIYEPVVCHLPRLHVRISCDFAENIEVRLAGYVFSKENRDARIFYQENCANCRLFRQQVSKLSWL